ncbi:putative BPI/LBP family protein At1g04970 isoform X2 [Manihot esculenta]|uniref:alpha-1,2-Mannosidase n=1 Tax=Manihot esculenta TaxID=3983 RepID=A0A2C9W8D9_MANES|nr:putative BPI/LBP family protein At1g04970 isoform X2 [Manihot esculenta]OAY55650.2 hypothetical protein MANES_03G136000v8 [Manihot esculenta]
MDIFLNFMASLICFLVLSLVLIPASTHPQSNEQGYTSVILSDKGIDFAKDMLIKKAVSSMIPLQLPDIEKYVKIPLLGRVHVVLSNITINSVIAPSSVETGATGIVLLASGATADLTMNWRYSYKSWIVVISDSGDASVKVKDMEVGLTVTSEEQDGTLTLSLLDCGCYVKDISIKMDGGASWLYQVVVDAFEGPIGSAVENAISKKIKEGISKLDSRLQSLPKQVSVDHVSAMNVTFTGNPVLVNSSIEIDINGLFMTRDNVLIPSYYYKGLQASDSSNCPAKMIGISLHENVFNTAAVVYFNAGYMHWTVDRFPNQSLLNTTTWRYIYPQLYEVYPNDGMKLNISLTSPPVIKIVENDLDVTIYLDVTVNVLDADEVIPVASVSLVVNASCSPHILRNKLAGILKLKNFTVSYNWSNIGDLHVPLVSPIAYAVVETIFLPYVNLPLLKGLPLPFLHGFTLKNAEIHCMKSKMMICSNLAFSQQYHIS